MPALRSLIIVSMMVTPPIVSASDNAPPKYDPVADPKAIVVSGNARFTVLTPGVIRMEYAPDGKFDDRASYVVVNRKLPVPSFRTGEAGSCSNIPFSWPAERTKKAIGIGTERIALAFLNDGKPFNKDNLLICTPKPASGVDVVWELSPPFASKNNLGGTVRTLDGVNGSVPLPDGILSRDGWYCLDDSQSLMFDANSPAGEGAGRYKDDPWIAPRNKPGYIDWYFFSYGHDYKQALKDYISVAGRIPMPPRFAFGTWWSRYWDYTDAELRQLVKEFKDHDVPLDVLVIDMGWHLDGWTGYTWNPKCFPDPEGFLKWVHEQGLKATLNLHPADGVGKHEKAFPEMCKAMGLDPGKTDVIPFDCTDRKYMDAYFKYLHHPLEAMGIDFWWMDWQQGKQTKMQGLDPLPWINYLHWHDMEKRAAETGKRPLLFSRWGGLGNHRYQIGFSGDTFSTWQSLAFQPYFTATAGNVGYAYWSHDIGGHMPGKVDPELYTRWIQWGALSPILRTHTTKNPEAERRIWAYPPEYFEAMKKAFELRYELIPYIYTAARQCYETGLPICRPLYYEWPDLDEAYKHPGEYMFGDQMLAAPVTEPSDPISKCAMVEVWLPPGKWTNWFTGRTYTGPGTFPLVVPLDEIPLFVKEGGIIVTQGRGHRNDDGLGKALVIKLFPGGTGETRLYQDDGSSQGYVLSGAPWTTVSETTSDGKRQISIKATGGAEAKAIGDIEVRFLDIGPVVEKVVVNGKELEELSERPIEANDFGKWAYSIKSNGIVVPLMLSTTAGASVIVLTQDGKAPDSGQSGVRGLVDLTYKLGFLFAPASARSEFPPEVPEGPNHFTSAVVWMIKHPEQVQQPSASAALVAALQMRAVTLDTDTQDPSLEREAFTRMLGLYYKLSIGGEGRDHFSWNARIKVSTTLPPAKADSVCPQRMDGTVSIQCTGGWKTQINGPTSQRANQKRDNEAEWKFTNLSGENPFDASVSLLPGNKLSTSILSAHIKIQQDESEIDIPIERIILPSINAWYILGPFENPSVEGLKREFPPDKKVDLAAEYDGKGGKKIKWRKIERQIKPGDDLTGEFFVDFDDVFGERVYECVVYGFTFLDAPEDMDAVLALGTDDGCSVVLNGQEVFRVEVGRGYISKQDHVPVKLKKGQNTLMLKVFQGGGDGGLCVHIENKDGKPLTQVKPHL
jgi:alpha-glucosidase (family GH31 glycosyl hydrolase)